MFDANESIGLRALQEDRRFQELCQPGNGFNFAHAVGFNRDELSYSRLIAYLLDSRAGHRLSKPLFAELALRAGYSNVAPESIRAQTEIEFIDIYADSPDFLIGIENKIDAPEGRKQLARYQSLLSKRAGSRPAVLFFLTPTGRRARTADPQLDVPVIALSYGELGGILDSLVDCLGTYGDDTRFASLCANHFREQVMHSGYLHTAARELWADEATVRGMIELLRHRPSVDRIRHSFEQRAENLVEEVLPGSKAVVHLYPATKRPVREVKISVDSWRKAGFAVQVMLHDNFEEPVFPEIHPVVSQAALSNHLELFRELKKYQESNFGPDLPKLSFEPIPGWSYWHTVWEGQNGVQARRITAVQSDDTMIEQAIEYLRMELEALAAVIEPFLAQKSEKNEIAVARKVDSK